MAKIRRPADPPEHADVTEAALLHVPNAALDRLFRSSPVGDIPDGDMHGMLVAFPGTRAAKPLALMTYAIAWQGKVIDRSRGVLTNKITPVRLRAVKARVCVADSRVDGGACILIDYSRTSLVARLVRDEIRLVGPHLYLGVVWLRRRRVAWFALRSTGAR